MKIKLYCVRCFNHSLPVLFDTNGHASSTLLEIIRMIASEELGWIVNLNGDNIEVCCSKKCAR